MGKKKPYKYNSKSRLTADSQSFPFKVNHLKNDLKENLENTLTKLRIIEEPQEEKKQLDNTFLEGRTDTKDLKKKKQKKKETEKEKVVETEEVLSKISFVRKILLTISGVCACILIIFYLTSVVFPKISYLFHVAQNRVVVVDRKASNVIDDNYLFVGGFHTNRFNFQEYGWDYHYVNVSRNDLTTHMLLDNMKGMVYDYNPSVVFLELGIVDLDSGVSEEEFLENYRKIIDSIQSNRPNAIIFIESIYPMNPKMNSSVEFNSHISNEMIASVNYDLKKLAKEKNVRYFDTYSVLSRKNELDEKYTEDGVLLNRTGYQALFQEINKVVG